MSRTLMAIMIGILATLMFVPGVLAQTETSTPTPTPVFVVDNLVVVPQETTVGKEVNVIVDIRNMGDGDGNYEAILKVNAQQVDSKTVYLASGQTQRVEFAYTPAAKGSITLTVGDRNTSLKVSLASEQTLTEGPHVSLRPLTDTITASQDGLVEIAVVNPSQNEVDLNGDIYIQVPSGLHVGAEGFGLASAAGMVYGHLNTKPGTMETMQVYVKADETAVGETLFVHFTGNYWPGDNKALSQPISLTYPIKVIEQSKDVQASDSQIVNNDDGGIWYWWIIVIIAVALMGIALIVAFIRRGASVHVES